MKKTFILIAAAVSIMAVFPLSAATMDATVVSVRGKAEVMQGSSWSALSVGNTLHKGDVIQTGFKSELIIKIKDSTVSVSSLSRITIEQLAAKSDKDETRLFLDTGSLRSDVKRTEDRRVGFTVRSPVATASVRGTIMEVTNTFSGTVVKGFEGSTAVWKTSGIQSPEIGSDDETDSMETPGDSASAVSDGQSGPGAVLVKRNMSSSVTEDDGHSAPKDTAAKGSADLGGAKNPATESAPDRGNGENRGGQNKKSRLGIRVSIQD